MPPPSEHPLRPPRPKPKPPKPRHKRKQKAVRPAEPVRVQSHGGVPFPPDPFACAAQCSDACSYYRLCPPPPPSSRSATVHLRSSHLPTPLVALSASVLAVSAVLLLALLVCHLVRRRTRRIQQQQQQGTPLAHLADEEGGPAPAPAMAADEGGDGAGPGVHHVWYIRTVGLDERAIATITPLVYNAGKWRADGGDDYGSCTVCLAEFRDGETLRLLPRCRHAFHRGCIDTWLRAHANCPLCRAPVQAAAANAVPGTGTGAAPGGELAASLGVASSVDADRDGVLMERAVRRAASTVALPRLPWPDASLRAPASSSWREGETDLMKISRLLKLTEALEMAGVEVSSSISFRAGRAASFHHFTGPAGPSAATGTGTNADEVSR